MDGLAEFDVDAFFVDFYNQPVEATATGVAVLRSIGRQRYKGIDLDGALRPAEGWTLKASIVRSDARYRDFLTNIEGKPTQLAGNRQVLTPLFSRSAGVIYAPQAAGADRSSRHGPASTG